MRYAFEHFTLDIDKHELAQNGSPVSIEPQVFALLAHLVTNRERVVSRDELIEAIWDGRFVSDAVVSSRIKSARKVLGDDGRKQSFIKTIHGTGFRFVAAVEEDGEPDAPSTAQASQIENEAVPVSPPQHAAASQITPRHLAFLGLFVVAAIAALQFLFGTLNRPPESVLSTSQYLEEVVSTTADPRPSAERDTIAVLPFDDFSEAGDQVYFADGVAEELLNTLAKVDGLTVTSRTSSFSFRSSDESASAIARKLGVRHLLEGSVRKAGDRLRITAQLIDAQEDTHIWSETYERALTAGNLFDVQDEIATAIATALQRSIVSPDERSALQTASIEAYDAYLLGRSLIAQRTAETVNAGIAQLKKAAGLDPKFAPAHSSLVDAYVLANAYAGFSLDEAANLARPHVEKAIALAPEAPESLASKGRFASIFDRNDVEAIIYLERAIKANPSYAAAHRLLALAHSALSHVDAAKASFESARRLDPIAPVLFENLYRTSWDRGDLDTMRALGQEIMRLNPDSIFARRVLGGSLRESGQYAAAHRLFIQNDQRFGASHEQLARLYYLVGRNDLALPYKDKYVSARIALHEGHRQRAIDLIESEEPLYQVAIRRWAGDAEDAYRIAKADIAQRHLLSEETQVAVRYQTFDVYYLALLSEKNDPAAEVFRARLSARFENASQDDFKMRDSLYAGVLWNLLNGETGNALIWLDALIEAGHTWPDVALEPLIDEHRGNADFQSRLDQLEQNSADHRSKMELPLAGTNRD